MYQRNLKLEVHGSCVKMNNCPKYFEHGFRIVQMSPNENRQKNYYPFIQTRKWKMEGSTRIKYIPVCTQTHTHTYKGTQKHFLTHFVFALLGNEEYKQNYFRCDVFRIFVFIHSFVFLFVLAICCQFVLILSLFCFRSFFFSPVLFIHIIYTFRHRISSFL